MSFTVHSLLVNLKHKNGNESVGGWGRKQGHSSCQFLSYPGLYDRGTVWVGLGSLSSCIVGNIVFRDGCL